MTETNELRTSNVELRTRNVRTRGGLHFVLPSMFDVRYSMFILFLLLVSLSSAPPSLAADEEKEGLDATVTDTYDFQVKLNGLALRMKAPPDSGAQTVLFDYLPLVADGKEVRLWLAQIGTAAFSLKDDGSFSVQAVLQGQGEKVSGTVAKPADWFFEGKIAEGDRKGGSVKFPLLEVKSMQVTTAYEGAAPGPPGPIPPLPGQNDDVFWVSSVPLGAEVWATMTEGKEKPVWGAPHRLGVTPLSERIPPGKYRVKVVIPARLAATLRSSTKLASDLTVNPFEFDGCKREDGVQFDSNNLVQSVTYEVNKQPNEAATLIALFQKKDQTLADVIQGYPAGTSFRFSDKKMEGQLLSRKIPKPEIPALLDALHRGGKIVWHGADQTLIIELVPGEPGVKFSEGVRPKTRK